MRMTAGSFFALLWLLTILLVLVWDQNPISIVACALGISAVLLVIFRLRWQRAIGAAASLLFVVNWALAFLQSGGGTPFDDYLAVIQGVADSSTLVDAAIVLGYELVLPLLHLAVFIALTLRLIRGR
ncbi:MAG: hypothetical protein R3337_05355 [Gammaproteobacteria bacterium]|nr:hypothetical protein [Gammaproteobacteria bacterium]